MVARDFALTTLPFGAGPAIRRVEPGAAARFAGLAAFFATTRAVARAGFEPPRPRAAAAERVTGRLAAAFRAGFLATFFRVFVAARAAVFFAFLAGFFAPARVEAVFAFAAARLALPVARRAPPAFEVFLAARFDFDACFLAMARPFGGVSVGTAGVVTTGGCPRIGHHGQSRSSARPLGTARKPPFFRRLIP
jgi:hypothetical protein